MTLFYQNVIETIRSLNTRRKMRQETRKLQKFTHFSSSRHKSHKNRICYKLFSNGKLATSTTTTTLQQTVNCFAT